MWISIVIITTTNNNNDNDNNFSFYMVKATALDDVSQLPS